jgi:hypothetical protein
MGPPDLKHVLSLPEERHPDLSPMWFIPTVVTRFPIVLSPTYSMTVYPCKVEKDLSIL